MNFNNPRTTVAASSSVASYTWNTKPNANTLAVGTQIRISDVGVSAAGSIWVSDGINYRPLTGRILLRKLAGRLSAPVVTYTGTTTESKLIIPGGDTKFPAGMLLPNSVLVITTIEKLTGTSNMARKMRLGTAGTTFNGSAVMDSSITANSSFIGDIQVSIAATNAVTSTTFIGRNASAAGGLGDLTNQINTTVDMYLTIDVAPSNTTDSYNLIAWTVELIQ